MNTEPHVFEGQPLYFTTDARGMPGFGTPGFGVRCSDADCDAVLEVFAMDTRRVLTSKPRPPETRSMRRIVGEPHARSQAQEGR